MKSPQVLAAAALLMISVPAVAQTPDGVPPSQETVCDPLAGRGPAFGLCNAYCEAMDCDSPGIKASSNACSQVEANFTRLTGDTLPCLAKPSCPCAEKVGSMFADFVDGAYPIDSCRVLSGVGFSLIKLSSGALEVSATQDPGSMGLCEVEIEGDTIEELRISSEKGAVCIDLLAQAAGEQGVECVRG